MKYPKLYKLGRRNGLYDIKTFSAWVMQGLFQSAVIYLTFHFACGQGYFPSGRSIDGTWMFGSAIFGSTIILVNLVIALHTKYWIWVQYFCIWASVVSWWLVLLVSSSIAGKNMLVSTPDFVGDYEMVFQMYGKGSSVIWLCTLLSVVTGLIPSGILRILQDEPGGAFGLVYDVRMRHLREDTSSMTNCGCCGIPVGQNPMCCGEGCVDERERGKNEAE